MRAAMLMDATAGSLVFDDERFRRLSELVDLAPGTVVTSVADLDPRTRAQIELLVTGWGVRPIGARERALLPRLRAVVHWGGSTDFLDPEILAGLDVRTAREANAIPVAEFTEAMIILASKEAFWASRTYCAEQVYPEREVEFPRSGLVGARVGVVGASTIGSLVIDALTARGVRVAVYDPTWDAAVADRRGIRSFDDLVELAAWSSILTLHAPVIPATQKMISAAVIGALPDGATLINTARGAIVDQDALLVHLRSGRIRAILDVTEPEPLPRGHELFSLPSVFLTPHVAGSMGTELTRLGDAALAAVAAIVSADN